MQHYSNNTYWDWYIMPVEFRKWYVKRTIKRLETTQQNQGDSPKPLTQSERIKFMKDSQKVSNNPVRNQALTNPFSSNKNK